MTLLKNGDQERTANTVSEITDITNTVGSAWAQPVYNAAGNMTKIPRQTGPSWSSLTADGWGNLTAEGWGTMTVEPPALTATYDAWNRLVKLVDAGTDETLAEYQYDGAKRRIVEKSYSSGTLSETRHLYYTEPSKWQVIEERLGSSTDPDCQNIWGLRYIDDLVLRDRSVSGILDERLYCLQDANWNTTSLVDAEGVVQERDVYSAYGIPEFLNLDFTVKSTSSFDWNVLYGGYRWSSSALLYNVRNRKYDPLTGVWLQRDPLGITTDNMNVYLYASNVPLTASDPSGLMAISAGVAVAIGLSFWELVALAILLGISYAALVALLSRLGKAAKCVIDNPPRLKLPTSCHCCCLLKGYGWWMYQGYISVIACAARSIVNYPCGCSPDATCSSMPDLPNPRT